jgi:hypothetical protein
MPDGRSSEDLLGGHRAQSRDGSGAGAGGELDSVLLGIRQRARSQGTDKGSPASSAYFPTANSLPSLRRKSRPLEMAGEAIKRSPRSFRDRISGFPPARKT